MEQTIEKYRYNLLNYKIAKEIFKNNELYNLCILRYELNLLKFTETHEDKYKIILDSLDGILGFLVN